MLTYNYELCKYVDRRPNILPVTKDKQHKVPIGFAQNIKQLKCACETNKRKRKQGDDDFDYLYGIVGTGIKKLWGKFLHGTTHRFTYSLRSSGKNHVIEQLAQHYCAVIIIILNNIISLISES